MAGDEKKDGGLFGIEFPEISWAKFWDELVNTLLASDLGGWLAKTSSALVTEAVTVGIATFIEVVGAAGETIGKSIDSYEKEAGPQLLNAAASGLSDLFGIPISPSELGIKGGTDQRRATSDRIGKEVIARLLEGVASGGTVSGRSGVESAQKMVGFVTSTALEGWLTGVLSHSILTKWIPNWADLDQVFVDALGLSRLSRAAFKPIIDVLITEPFTWHMNTVYRPARFREPDAVRAWIQGQMTEDEYFTRMGELGWSREGAASEKLLRGRFPFKEDLARMLRLGMIDEERAKELFRMRGFLPDMSELLMQMYRDLGIDEANQRVKLLFRTMYASREITEAEARSGMTGAGVGPKEIDKWIAVGDVERSRPRHMTQAQYEKAYRLGMIDQDTLEARYVEAGFPPADVALLIRIAVQGKLEAEGKTDKEKTLAQGKIEKAYQLGIASETELRTWYEEAGYDPGDQAMLVKIQKVLKAGKTDPGQWGHA